MQALAVMDLGPEVDVAHGLDQDIEAGGGPALRDLYAVLLHPPVHDPDERTVQKDPGKVTSLLGTKLGRRAGGQRGAIQDAASTLVVGLHGARRLVLDGGGQVVEDGSGRRRAQSGRSLSQDWRQGAPGGSRRAEGICSSGPA